MITIENFHQCLLTKNDCYIRNTNERKLPTNQQDSRYRNYYQGPTKIVVHSTGANNPYISRYVQPNDGLLGENKYGNSWNNSGLDVCVNAFIGKVTDGSVAVYQTLPWDYRPWGVGSGSKGSYNDCAIQFEICEDKLVDANYAKECYERAAQLCAYLCDEYDIPVAGIVSHKEAHEQGYGSNHGDPEHWWRKFGLSMSNFRARVQEILDSKKEVENMTDNLTRYNTINEMPDYAKSTIEKLVNKGYLKGDGNGFDLSLDMVRMFVILDRAGMFGA